MSQILDQLTVNQDLVLDFFATFSRFEFALKAAGYVKGTENSAAPDWDRFAQRCRERFEGVAELALDDGIKYLLAHPPKKQVLVRGRLDWKDAPPEPNVPMLQSVLFLVRRVRNNLFHGGKYPGGPVKEMSRDARLLESSIKVLEHCVGLDTRVEREFYRADWAES